MRRVRASGFFRDNTKIDKRVIRGRSILVVELHCHLSYKRDSPGLKAGLNTENEFTWISSTAHDLQVTSGQDTAFSFYLQGKSSTQFLPQKKKKCSTRNYEHA